VTLYRVGVVKQASETTTYVAIDGGMSDNPRPQLYGAVHSALLANRAAEKTDGVYSVAGKHCESGDVLIQRVELPRAEERPPAAGDIPARNEMLHRTKRTIRCGSSRPQGFTCVAIVAGRGWDVEIRSDRAARCQRGDGQHGGGQ